MNIAIFGSCVSRDTAEFIPDSNVVAYIARHSVTSLETPHGTDGVDLSGLTSAFQKRMVTSDLKGDGIARIDKEASDIDLVLIDLVDERRGYWRYPDGTTMTNSLELESCGVARDARQAGARLVKFGTDEHFVGWKSGFTALTAGLKDAGLWGRALLVDVEWAGALDGAKHPRTNIIAHLGRSSRKLQRGARDATRGLSAGVGLGQALLSMRHVKPTEAEVFANRAFAANREFIRYRKEAHLQTAASVMRSSKDLRIDREHKWGPQPFHYRKQDYDSIAQSIILQSGVQENHLD